MFLVWFQGYYCWTTIDRMVEQPSTGECWIPPKKDTPHPRAKERFQQEGRRGEMAFRIKPHSCQRSLEGSNKTLCPPGPRDSTESEPDLPLSVSFRGGSAVACCGDRVSGCSRLGRHSVWIALLKEVAISPTIEPPSRRPTNWRTIVPKKFSHCYVSSRTHNRFHNLGIS